MIGGGVMPNFLFGRLMRLILTRIPGGYAVAGRARGAAATDETDAAAERGNGAGDDGKARERINTAGRCLAGRAGR